MKKIVIIFTLIMTASSLASCNKKDDFTIMRDEYRKFIMANTNISEYQDKSAEEILHKEGEEIKEKEIGGIQTYYFPDLKYDECYERPTDTWPAIKHLNRTIRITVTAAKRHDNKIKDIAIKLTYYWVFNNYRNTNWWNNEIGANGILANIAMFIYQDLNVKGQVALSARLAESSFRYRLSLLTHAGANLFDYANLTLQSSIINRDRKEFELAISRIEDEVTDDNREGFQKDGSFFQHGQQIQMFSYGLVAMNISKVLKFVSKTSQAFDKNRLGIISRFILRGLRSTSHKGYVDYLTGGRGYTRENPLDLSNYLSRLSMFLDVSHFPDRDELEKYLDDIKNKRSTFNGIVYFDNAKMVTMNIDDLYISFRGSNPNLTNTECVTDENCLGLNLSYATNTCVMDKGNEYNNAAQFLDYSYLPGTTSLQYYPGEDFMEDGNDEILYELVTKQYGDGLYEQRLPSESEGDYLYRSGYDSANNVAYFMQRSCHHKENNFTVTAIACEDGLVLIGNDLEYTGSVSKDYLGSKYVNTNLLHTTLRQCMKTGNETLSADKKELTCGNAFYRILDDHEIKYRDKHVESKAYRNRRLPDKDLGDPIEGDTYLAYINHDLSNGVGKYAYSIQPTTRKDKKFEIINNFKKDNEKVQEVKLPNNKIVIAAYQDVDEYLTSTGKTIELKKGDFKII